jgi:glycerate 2-kinase
MIEIQNKSQLIMNGGSEYCNARKMALQILESALGAADPRLIVKSAVSLNGSILKAGDYCFDLSDYKHVYVVGGGKASGAMTEAIEDLMGSYITEGVVNIPLAQRYRTKIITLNEAAHPIPDEAGIKGTQRILDIAEKAGKNDLVICLISGGGSSLLPSPRGITLANKQELTNKLLRSGATINEINVVRKHISNIKGGWLARRSYPATVLGLIISDVVGDDMSSVASGPTVPDPYTFFDTRKILEKYNLWGCLIQSVKTLIIDGEKGLIPDTPKPADKTFEIVHNVVIGSSKPALKAAYAQSKALGLNSLLLTTTLKGEAKHVGAVFASIIRELQHSSDPIPKPAAIIAGGETTVTVTGKGIGGRNQELALAAAAELGDGKRFTFASLSTDGVDGPTDAAGAIIDGTTMFRAKKTGLAPERYLAQNDSYSFFQTLGDLIFTGVTGTNVNDIQILIVL